MVARTIGCGRDVAGLYVGTHNARRHFPRKFQHIELQLGHLHIFCDLPPEFWQGRPQICDARLADWLFSSIFHGKQHRGPARVSMIPLSKNAFRVTPYSAPSISANALTHIGPPPAKREAVHKVVR